MARFPDSRIDAASLVFPGENPPSDRTRTGRETRPGVLLTAYSGGTVWDLHPLRVAAGASVKLCPDYTAGLWLLPP